jgi:ribosomal protein S20
MTETEFVKSPARNDLEKLFVSEMRTTVKALREALAAKPATLAEDHFASAVLRTLRAGWLLTCDWDS